MTINVTDELRDLYAKATAEGALEKHARAYWDHWLTKHAFHETFWMYHVESEVDSTDRLRRVDGSLRYLYRGQQIVLFFVEFKKHNASLQDLGDVEGQLTQACVQYLGSSQQSLVYGMATIGTKARVWRYVRYAERGQRDSLFGSDRNAQLQEYVDGDAYDTSALESAIQIMRQFPQHAYTGFLKDDMDEDESDDDDDDDDDGPGSAQGSVATQVMSVEQRMISTGYTKIVARSGTVYWQDRSGKRKVF